MWLLRDLGGLMLISQMRTSRQPRTTLQPLAAEPRLSGSQASCGGDAWATEWERSGWLLCDLPRSLQSGTAEALIGIQHSRKDPLERSPMPLPLLFTPCLPSAPKRLTLDLCHPGPGGPTTVSSTKPISDARPAQQSDSGPRGLVHTVCQG